VVYFKAPTNYFYRGIAINNELLRMTMEKILIPSTCSAVNETDVFLLIGSKSALHVSSLKRPSSGVLQIHD
jgi:hypothetical protein